MRDAEFDFDGLISTIKTIRTIRADRKGTRARDFMALYDFDNDEKRAAIFIFAFCLFFIAG